MALPVRHGYCTNVHAGQSVTEILENFKTHSAGVKQAMAPDTDLGLGLWLSASVVADLQRPGAIGQFGGWLKDHGFFPFTINGFPFGNFHNEIVKHDVYLPTWADSARLEYTWQLAQIHHWLLPPDAVSTISTLPLGWPMDEAGREPMTKNDGQKNQTLLEKAIQNLCTLADRLARFHTDTGRDVVICLEPEPGCLLDTASDVVKFFEALFLAAGPQEDDVRRHIGVCHDVCHSAVMFEPQADAFRAYSAAGLRVGKVQVSSAIACDFNSLSDDQKAAASAQLQQFAEPKFLHQTSIRQSGEIQFFEDLPLAMKSCGGAETQAEIGSGEWRVHYHVPVYLESLGSIRTTQHEILECLKAIREQKLQIEHFELETYAWNELPQELAGV